MSKSVSNSLGTSEGDEFGDSDVLSTLLRNKTGAIVNQEDKNESRLNLISSIDSNVAAILELLRQAVESGSLFSKDTPF